MVIWSVLYVHPHAQESRQGLPWKSCIFGSAIEFIFEDKNSLHFWGPNEQFGTHEKLSCGACKVGQISSQGKLG